MERVPYPDAGASVILREDLRYVIVGQGLRHTLSVARELGLKTVVVDHHRMSAYSPPADVFVNPHQEGCGFIG